MLVGPMAPPLDAQIDRLYQLPLDEFTPARNALAKEAGSEGDAIKKLQKPPLAAWAINQVYWRNRPAFHAFTASAAALRSAHTAVVSGKKSDLRAAGQAHEEAVEAVLKTALAILRDSGHPVTDGTKQAIATTLRALPASPDAPGRLSRTLQPSGFELLAGLPSMPAVAAPRREPATTKERSAATAPTSRTKDAARERALAKAKQTLATATRSHQEAEHNAKRDEFDAAKAARDAERASERLTKARAAREAAQEAEAAAEEEMTEASRRRDGATRRARESASALAAANVRLEAARAELERAEER
jgi:hypothetical protein